MQGPGLAYVAFSQAVSLFPGSSFWAIIFFMALVITGMGTMITLLEGIVLPLQNNNPTLSKHPKLVPGTKAPTLKPSPYLPHPKHPGFTWTPQLTNPSAALPTSTFSVHLLGRTSGQPGLHQPPRQLCGVPVR